MLSGLSEQYPVTRTGRNERTAEDWLEAILHSGQVTRVAQHLALVIFHIADEKGVAAISMRELERITGWSKSTLAAHLAEIKTFIDVTLGRGRGRSTFALQGMITEAVVAIRSVQQPDAKSEVPNDSVHDKDATAATKHSVHKKDAIPDATPDTTNSVQQANSTPDTTIRSVQQPDANSNPSRARIESPSGILSSIENNNISPPTPPTAPDEQHAGHGVWVNCDTIRHKDFRISLPSLELAIAGRLPKDEIKAKATAHALQWAAEIEGGKKPADVVPSKIANFLSASLMGEINRAAAADAKLAKAKQGSKPFRPSRWAPA